MQRSIIYPEVITNIRDIQFIFGAEEKLGTEFENYIAELNDNLNVATARESGIARREKILGIKPLDTDSLEDRRLRLMLKWYERAPYTIRVLRQRLDSSLGAGNYVLNMDYGTLRCTCLVELTRKAMLNSVKSLLEDMLPLNIIYKVDLRYNTWEVIKKLTWGQLKEKTWGQIKEEVL